MNSKSSRTRVPTPSSQRRTSGTAPALQLDPPLAAGRADARRRVERRRATVRHVGLGRNHDRRDRQGGGRRRRDDLQRLRIEEGPAARGDGHRRRRRRRADPVRRTRGVHRAWARHARRAPAMRASPSSPNTHERSAGVWRAIMEAAVADPGDRSVAGGARSAAAESRSSAASGSCSAPISTR